MLIIVVLQIWQLYKSLKRVHTGLETLFRGLELGYEGIPENATPQGGWLFF